MLIKLCILLGGLFSFSILPETSRSRDDSRCVDVSVVGETAPGATLSALRCFCFFFLSMIKSLLKTIRCLAKNRKGATLLPPSDVYVRSFLYLFYTLIKLGCTKAPSGQALSLAPHQNPFLWRPRTRASFMANSHNLSSWDLQDKV